MAGILTNSSYISWNGRYGNSTFEGLENMIYGYNYITNLKKGLKSDSDNELKYDPNMETIIS